jgi:ketosteroid isomerase-like protein
MPTITTDNAARVSKIFEAFGRGDVPDILDQMADDAQFASHLDAVVPWAGKFNGKAEIAGYFQALGSAVEVIEHPVNEIVAQGETVVATGQVSFRVRATGKQGSSAWVYLFRLADGQVQSFEQFNDTGLAAAFR